MPINQTGSASLAGATVPTVPADLLRLLIAEARETTQEQGNLVSLVTNDTLPAGMGTTYNSPKLGGLVASSLTQGVDMVQQQSLAATNIVITPGEVGVQTLWTRKSLAQFSENMQKRAGAIMRQALDRKKDTDIAGLAASLNVYTALGGTTTVLSVGHLAAAFSALKSGGTAATSTTLISAGTVSNQVPPGPINGVFRWESLTSVMRGLVGGPMATTPTVAVTTVGASGGPGSYQHDVLQGESLYVNQVAGVHLYGNSNFARATSNVHTDSFVFHKGAMIYVGFPHEMAGGDIMVEEDLSLRSIELNMVEDYGFGILDANYGIEMTFDSTSQTS